ncbi:MAG: hypothetical protein VW230_03690 [Candidatus Poseidoniales archaeon]
MARDPKAPQLAAIARILLGLTIGFLIVNIRLDLLNVDFFIPVSYIFAVFILVLLYINHWASKENPVPELNQQHPDNEVDGAYREGRTLFESSSTYVDEYGFEVSAQPSSLASQTVLQSIFTQREEPDRATIDSALYSLSSGESAQQSILLSAAQPAPHSKTSHHRESTPTDEQTGRVVQRMVQPQIPLPGKTGVEIPDVAAIPGLGTTREFISSGISEIPLPAIDLPNITTAPDVDLPNLDDLPSIDDILFDEIDDVFDFDEPIEVETTNSQPAQQSTIVPLELPSLDDLDF